MHLVKQVVTNVQPVQSVKQAPHSVQLVGKGNIPQMEAVALLALEQEKQSSQIKMDSKPAVREGKAIKRRVIVGDVTSFWSFSGSLIISNKPFG